MNNTFNLFAILHALFNSRQSPPWSDLKAICDYFRIWLLHYHFVNHRIGMRKFSLYYVLVECKFGCVVGVKVRRWKSRRHHLSLVLERGGGVKWRPALFAPRPEGLSFLFLRRRERNKNLMVFVWDHSQSLHHQNYEDVTWHCYQNYQVDEWWQNVLKYEEN